MGITKTLIVAGISFFGTGSAFADGYENLSACEKEEILWNKVEESRYQSLPQWTGLEPLNLVGLALNPFKSFARDFFKITMDRESDELPERRSKHIHTYGSVARIAFEPESGSEFTGAYEGVPCGLIRLSLAAKPEGGNSTPGLAVKFLVDGKPSMNFMTMYSLDGQNSYNFFKNDFTNFVAQPSNPALKLLAAAFGTVTQDPTKIDVAFLAKLDADGNAIAATESSGPEQIYLIPNRAQVSFADAPHEVRDDFATIPAGTALYEVYGRKAGSQERARLGRIVTKSDFISSRYGDEKLFFRHERFQGK